MSCQEAVLSRSVQPYLVHRLATYQLTKAEVMELDNLVVRPATYEQWLRTHEDQWPPKGHGLTLEQFSAKEHRLCLETDFGSKNFHRWVLVPREDPETLNYASSCKSYTRPIYLRDGTGVDPREAVCHAVAGVFTPVHNRNRSYAQRMMSLLHDQFSKDGILSVLYSDVGDFYSKATQISNSATKAEGWTIVSPFQVKWSVHDGIAASPNLGFRFVQESDFQAICEEDAQLLQEEVQRAKSPAFAILPTADQILWLTERCKFFENLRCAAGGDTSARIDNWGCQLGDIGAENWAFCIWSYDRAKSELKILRLRCTTQDQLRTLIKAAQAAGKGQGMKEVVAWNLDDKLAESCGWSNVRRTSSLPALAWYGEGQSPKYWLANEYWAWC